MIAPQNRLTHWVWLSIPLLLACPPHPNPGPPATSGAITVAVGFAAPVGTQCTGTVAVTATPQALTGPDGQGTASTQSAGFIGLASMIDARHTGCQVSVIFTNMKVGTWQISAGASRCSASVTAGTTSNVSVWEGVCGA